MGDSGRVAASCLTAFHVTRWHLLVNRCLAGYIGRLPGPLREGRSTSDRAIESERHRFFKAVFLRHQKSDLRYSGGLFISVRFVFYHTRKLIHASHDNLEGDQEPVFSSIDTSVSHLWPRAPYPDSDPMGRWRSKDGPGGKWIRWPRRRIRRP